MRLLPLIAMFVCACEIAEDHFDEVVAEDWCARQKACDEDLFFDTWLLGTPDCRAAVADAVNDKRYGNGNSACSYASELAAGCVRSVRSATCDEILAPGFVDECSDDVWDCISINNPGNP